jgi:hypothetical protein
MNLRNTVALLLILAAAAGDVVAVHASIRALACCATTHNECAGLKTPDDCCRNMGHGVALSVSTTAGGRAHPSGLMFDAVLPAAGDPAAATCTACLPEPAFKRPHDPPHLHPVPLLI